MKFRIHRSSESTYGYDPEEGLDQGPPIDGATFDYEESKELWEYVWTIEVKDMDDLFNLISQEGYRFIVDGPGSEDKGAKALPTIEIYNQYRE